MAKWADYVIIAKKMNWKGTHINSVEACTHSGSNLGPAMEMTRQQVVFELKRGTTFVTSFRNSEGLWALGEKVYVVPILGEDYIKTVADNTTRDNLDKLPDF